MVIEPMPVPDETSATARLRCRVNQLVVAAIMYWSSPVRMARIGGGDNPLARLLLNAFYVDALYDRLFVRPYFALSEFLAGVFDVEVVDQLVIGDPWDEATEE